ncbi:MAG: MATE family efflux transporter [Lachnospiraceae bacterium]|nr:MATE family efflux transporter [Lachnospiraceae bacterium]
MEQNSKRTINMLEGSLWDKILRYAFPLAATGILQQLFNAADIAVVGRFTKEQGAIAMAAVGANSPLIGLVLNIFIGISLGTNVIIANSVGSRDEKSIRKAAHTSIVFALIAGVILAILAEILASVILRSQNIPDEVLPMAVLYFRVYMFGTPVIILYNFISAVFRGLGNTRTPLIVLVFSGLLNVVLNLFFVIVLHRTVEGVAAATVISNAVSCVILMLNLNREDSPVRLRKSELRIDGRILRRILRIGIPAGIQSSVFGFANILIQSAINSLGTIVMAASSAAFNIEIFVYNVFNSFSQACTTFVGQNYGGGKIDRCRKVLILCLVEGAICMGTAIGLVLLIGKQMIAVFNNNPDVIEVGYMRLLIIFTAYIFSLTYEVISGYLRGFGVSVSPAILTMIGVCGVRVSWIYLVFPRYRTFRNIMLAYPLSLSTTAVLMVIALLCIRPTRKKQQMIQESEL